MGDGRDDLLYGADPPPGSGIGISRRKKMYPLTHAPNAANSFPNRRSSAAERDHPSPPSPQPQLDSCRKSLALALIPLRDVGNDVGVGRREGGGMGWAGALLYAVTAPCFASEMDLSALSWWVCAIRHMGEGMGEFWVRGVRRGRANARSGTHRFSVFGGELGYCTAGSTLLPRDPGVEGLGCTGFGPGGVFRLAHAAAPYDANVSVIPEVMIGLQYVLPLRFSRVCMCMPLPRPRTPSRLPSPIWTRARGTVVRRDPLPVTTHIPHRAAPTGPDNDVMRRTAVTSFGARGGMGLYHHMSFSSVLCAPPTKDTGVSNEALILSHHGHGRR